MQKIDSKKIILALISGIVLCSLLGCPAKEKVVTYEVTRSGQDWVEQETIEEHRRPGGRVVVEKQFVYEKVKCVDKKGRKIKALTPEECIAAGGKVIDVTVIEEETVQKKKCPQDR